MCTWFSLQGTFTCDSLMIPATQPAIKKDNRVKNLTFIGAFTSRVPSVITGEGGWRGWVVEGGMLQ